MGTPSSTPSSTILVTGAAGFIGAHLARRLLDSGHRVVGVDSFTPYYDVALKRHRWAALEAHPGFIGAQLDIVDGDLAALFAAHGPACVVHLAGQAGVRHSLEAPRAYLRANLLGTWEVAEACAAHGVEHLVFSSTSSAYGARGGGPQEGEPFRETDPAAYPVSVYAATKLGAESLLHAQSHLSGLPTTALRFFTVYGPEGRPDMAPHIFTAATLRGEALPVFGHGDMARDFTFIDDLVEAVVRLLDVPPVRGAPVSTRDSLSPAAPFRTVNIGGNAPVALDAFIKAIERATGQAAVRDLQPMPPGDVRRTHADPALLRDLTGFVPATPIQEGIERYVAWFRSYYGV